MNQFSRLLKFNTLINKVLFFLALFLFAFIPLYPKFPLINFKGTFVAVRIEDFLIAFTVVLWIFYIFLNKKIASLIEDTTIKAILLFFSIGFLALFSAFFLTQIITIHLGLLHLLRRIEFILLLPVVATIFNTKKQLTLALVVLFLTTISVNIYAFGQQYLDWPVISTTNSEFAKGLILRLTPGARVNSTFAGHYDLAVFLSVVLVFLIGFFFVLNKFWKILIFILGGVSLFVLILTAARASFISAFVGIIFLLIFTKNKKYLLIVFVCIVLIGLYPSQLRDRFISTITINFLHMGQRYEGRNVNQQLENKLNIPTLSYKMASRSGSAAPFASKSAGIPVDIAPGEPIDETELGVYRSYLIRFNIEWPRAINAFFKNPLLGTGYASLGIATDNDFLRSLGEVGILGTLAFYLIFLSLWKKIFKGLKNEDKMIRYFSAGTLSMIIVFLINGTFIDVFEASKVDSLFWMILGLNLGVLNVENSIKYVKNL